MAGRFNNPFPQFMDSTPTMLSGAKLFFYASGTSTKLNTYSDATLSTPNTNPVVLNSAGRSSTDVYLQDLDYKVVLAPSTDSDPPTSPIWTADNYNARDSKLIAKTLTGSGSPTGAVAGTAGSASILPDFYWDFTNSILYVCTTTGTALSAVWTAVNAAAATVNPPAPQGYLTLASDASNPVLIADAVSSTAVYYTPYVGNLVPVYNGSSFVSLPFTPLTLTLTASQALNTLYDVFVFNNSGVLTLVTGPAWSVSTAGSGARGTGAGTTQLQRLNGLWVNQVQITGRNGATTYSAIAANTATYLGTIYIDGTAGQVTCHTTYGQSRKWGVWNAYNRQPISLKAGEGTASWSYATNTIRAVNGSSANSVTTLNGLPEDPLRFMYSSKSGTTVSSGGLILGQVGVGFNSIVAFSGQTATSEIQTTVAAGISTFFINTVSGRYHSQPVLGVNVITALETGLGSTSQVFFGTEANMLLTADWRG